MARIPIFLSAAFVIGLGIFGMASLGHQVGSAFLLGALTLGGGFLICGLFSLKMPWHGIIGAGVLALLGLGRGVLNFPDMFHLVAGGGARGYAPLLEFAVTLVCLFLFTRIYCAWKSERIRQVREEL